MSKPVVILGAGLSGLSCALHLGQKIGYGLYEKEKTVGGLCRSVSQDGFYFDYTGFRYRKTSTFFATTVG